MSLENILNKILTDAQEEADRIRVDGDKKAAAQMEAAEVEADALAEAMIKEAERQARLGRSRLVTQARLEKRIQVLAFKKKLIDRVLEEAFRKKGPGRTALIRKVILKDGIKEEAYDESRLMDELRPKLENTIIKILNIK